MTDTIRRPKVVTRQLADEVFERVATDLIASGDVAPGELLPSETKLAERYGVSRVTLRAALRMLQEAHLVRIQNGIGSVVLERPPVASEGLDQLCSMETFNRHADGKLGTTDLEWRQGPADAEAASKLSVGVGTLLNVATRVKLVGDVRVSFGIERVPADLLSLAAMQDEFAGSVMDVLLAHDELNIQYADAELVPCLLPADIARRIGVKRGELAQYLEQVMYSSDGTPVQWGEAWLLPEYSRFLVRRRRSRVAQIGH